jgi:hypothetical protein
MVCCVLILVATSLEPKIVRADDPLLARMISPKYRNAIFPSMENPEELKIRIQIDLAPDEIMASNLRVKLGRNDNVLREWEFTDLAREDILVLDIRDVDFAYTRSGPYIKDDNPYEIQLELFAGSTSLDVDILELHRYPPPPAGVTEVRIDDNDNVLINGEPFLILGVYIREKTPETYDQLKAWGFNAAKSTEGDYNDLWFMGTVAKLHATPEDLGWMRSRIQDYREDPQIIAWYIADEPNLSNNVDSDTLRLVYDMAREEDPYHPAGWVSTLLSSPGDTIFDILDYEKTADFIGIDAYPCYPDWTYLRNVTTNFELLRDPSLGAARFEHIDMPTWGVPQMFGSGSWRWPNPHEEKNMVFQYIANGNRVLFPYAYTGENIPMWEYWAETLIPELQSIDTAIFAPMKAGTSVPFPTNDITVQSSDPENLAWSYRQTEKAEYLFLINTTSQWNEPLDSRVPGPKDKVISVEVTFHEAGGESVEVLIRDETTPERFSLSENQLHLQLDGVNEQSSGVLVLRREKIPREQEDINMDGVVDVLDVQLWLNVSSGVETHPGIVERADVNSDGGIGEIDLQLILSAILE